MVVVQFGSCCSYTLDGTVPVVVVEVSNSLANEEAVGEFPCDLLGRDIRKQQNSKRERLRELVALVSI